MKGESSIIKKYIVLASICLLAFASLWFIFNLFIVPLQFQTEPTPTFVASRRELGIRVLIAISPLLVALAIAGLYIYLKRIKPTVLIKTVSKLPLGVRLEALMKT
jgi:hypothetical protein